MADLDVHATDGSADDLTDAADPLGALRVSIDALDDVIVGALVSRFQLALSATAHKGTIQDPAREAAVLDHVERFANDLGGHGAAIRDLYVAILAISRELQAGGSSQPSDRGEDIAGPASEIRSASSESASA